MNEPINSTLLNLFENVHLIQPPKNLDCVDDKKDAEWEVNFDATSAFLGPTLWSRTLTYDGDLKLDYTDLDDFLSSESGCKSPSTLHAVMTSTEALKEESHRGDEYDESSSSSSSNVDSRDDDDDDEDDDRDDKSSIPKVGVNFSPDDLALAMAPGQKNFDPTCHRFTEDELKPQPMFKKSKKQFVPHDLKDEKYWSRRKKNNMAAKRSRDARRIKENQIALRASFLEKENNVMKKQLIILRNENALLMAKIDSLIQ